MWGSLTRVQDDQYLKTGVTLTPGSTPGQQYLPLQSFPLSFMAKPLLLSDVLGLPQQSLQLLVSLLHSFMVLAHLLELSLKLPHLHQPVIHHLTAPGRGLMLTNRSRGQCKSRMQWSECIYRLWTSSLSWWARWFWSSPLVLRSFGSPATSSCPLCKDSRWE